MITAIQTILIKIIIGTPEKAISVTVLPDFDITASQTTPEWEGVLWFLDKEYSKSGWEAIFDESTNYNFNCVALYYLFQYFFGKHVGQHLKI